MKRFSFHARFHFRFRKDFRKYEFFHHPQQFFPYGMLNIENEAGGDENMNPIPTHLQVEHMVIQEGKCPVIFSHIWIRDDHKKIWSKTYMLLRDQRLFFSQKIQALAKFMRTPKEQAISMPAKEVVEVTVAPPIGMPGEETRIMPPMEIIRTHRTLYIIRLLKSQELACLDAEVYSVPTEEADIWQRRPIAFQIGRTKTRPCGSED
nr:uncharacterized protein LOC111512883 [Leptinotarsa decemlineata]